MKDDVSQKPWVCFFALPLALLVGVLSNAAAADFTPAKLSADGKIGVIGDSMAAGTHTSQMCGNTDAYQCLDDLMGSQSRDWSYLGGGRSWSIASRLGFDFAHVVNVADDGDRWTDALQQAVDIMADPQVEAVVIGLGANDVCAPQGHDFSGDLDAIALHIDDTLNFLIQSLPAGGRIYWSAVPDIVRLRDAVASRDHNYWFESCQATWDLDGDKVKDGAARGICDHFSGHDLCQFASVQEEAKDALLNLLLNRWFDTQGLQEGPCGKVLSSNSTAQDREEARQFNADLNALMAGKAAEYNGRQGVSVFYSDGVFNYSPTFRPYYLSRLDCFHPNRSGQMWLADQLWRDFDSDDQPLREIAVDEFDSQDYCQQEFTSWDSCWTEINDGGLPNSGDVRINVQELAVRDSDRGVWRGIDLERAEEAWVSFNWRREGLDRAADFVAFSVSPDGGQSWVELARFAGDGDDFNMHRGNYYDISPYAGADTQIRLLGASGLGGEDLVYFDNVKVGAWAPRRASDMVASFGSQGLWAYLNDARWSKLHNAAPDRLVLGDVDGNGENDVIADFGSTAGGLFVKRNLGGWTQLHRLSSELLAVGDLDNSGRDDVVIDFGAIGLWARMNDAGWLKLHNASPEQLVTADVDGNGQSDVVGLFNTGIFVKQNLGAWRQIHNGRSEQIAAADLDADGSDDLVIDFGATGLWARMNDASWLKLHNSSPELVATGDVDGEGGADVLGIFAGQGLWQKLNLGGWSQLHAAAPDELVSGDIDGSGQDDIAADFSSTLGGIHVMRDQGAWVKLYDSAAATLAMEDLDSR